MAQQIAAALTVESPLTIPQNDQALLGRDLTRLLQKRVAYHHSGLPTQPDQSGSNPSARMENSMSLLRPPVWLRGSIFL